MKLRHLVLATAAATASLAAHAEITVSPMVGYHLFGDDRVGETAAKLRADEAAEASLALGYLLNPNVGLELRYGQANPTNQISGAGNFRYEAATLDTYYKFNADQMLQPYVLVGAGLERFTPDQGGVINEYTIANAALGAFYKLTDMISLRGELRGVQNLQENDLDGVASLGVLFSFGGSKAAAPVAIKTVADSDNDGVADADDACPGTAAGVAVDAKGCPKMLTEKVTRELKVYFDTDKAVVKPAYNGEIEAVAKLLKEFPNAKVEVQGHTDARGSDSYNQKLSQARADAVAQVLVEQYGIAADRVASKGYGESQPVADNTTAEGRAKNRRTVAVAEGEVKVTVTK